MLGEPCLPMVVRTTADVESLLANSRQVRRLPESGLTIAVPSLDPLLAKKLNNSIVAYVKACGCATGGALALVSLVGGVATLALRIAQYGPRWSDFGLAAIGLFAALLMGGIGKIGGLTFARWRLESHCREVIQALAKDRERTVEGPS